MTLSPTFTLTRFATSMRITLQRHKFTAMKKIPTQQRHLTLIARYINTWKQTSQCARQTMEVLLVTLQKINQQKQLFQVVMALSSLKMITTQAFKFCNALSSQKHLCLKELQMPMLVATLKMSGAVRTRKLQTTVTMDKITCVLVAPLSSLVSQVLQIRLMIVNLVVQVQFVAQLLQSQRAQKVTIALP